MKDDKGRAIALFAIVMGGAVVLVIAGDVSARLCEGVDLRALNEGRSALSCREFWFNRYQGFVGGLLALLGAIGTVAAMRWQTKAEMRRRRKIALMRALAELRPFRFACEKLFEEVRFLEPEASVAGLALPRLKFPREPELLADLKEDEASQLMHFALIVDRVADSAGLVAVTSIFERDFLWAYSAYFAEAAFDLVNDTANALDWTLDKDRPSHDPDFPAAIAFEKEIKAELFGSHATPASA